MFPPTLTLAEVPLRSARYVAWSTILDQEDTSQLLVVLAKELQFGEVVCGVVLRQERQLHEPAMHHQEHQQVRRPMPGIIELLLFNRTGDPSADGPLQHLEGRDFIHAHHPDALFRKSSRISIAPQDLLRSLFEPGVQPRRLPIPSSMGLQIDVVQDTPNCCRADRREDFVVDGLAGQVLTGPMRDVQPFGNRLQAGEFNDLCSLHGRDLLRMARIALPAITEQARQAILAIPLASPPHRGFITFEPSGDRALTFASGNSQHDLGTLDMEPGQGTAMGGGMQNIRITSNNDQSVGSATTHEVTSDPGEGESSA